MERTNDLRKVRNGEPFTWGQIIKIMDIGSYTVASFWYRATDTTEREMFHGWINGVDCGHSWDSLEAAIVGLIAYKNDGPNSRAGEYFMRMIS